MKEIRSIKDLTPDPRNLNRGTQRGRGMLEQSLRKYGAGRSILTDKNGVVIAGNKVSEVAGEIDLPVREIQTRGRELIVVRRMDLDLEKDKAAKELAVADNRVAQIDLDWNPDLLKELSAEIDLGQFWMESELELLSQSFNVNGIDAPVLSNIDRNPFQQMTFTLHDEQAEEVKAALEKAKAAGGRVSAVNENSNGNALAFICEAFNRG